MIKTAFMIILAFCCCVVLSNIEAAPTNEKTTWSRPDAFFSVNGSNAFLFGRNPTGWQQAQFDSLINWASASGERILRIHITTGFRPNSKAGVVDDAWAERWGHVFDQAAEQGLYVIPVFSAWAKWNDGSTGNRWHYWDKNPYNTTQGGPAEHPSELFAETPCQNLWMQWLEQMVGRWKNRPNILAWEVFSELDLITGSSEQGALQFMQRASKVIRETDHSGRAITASLAGIHNWPLVFGSDAVDWVQIHPYAGLPDYQGQLDRLIIETVRARLEQYEKPVFIGESGLDSRPPQDTLDTAGNAEIGLRHAFWAAAVSGAMNGRMLWWGDGYDQYRKPDPKLRERYAILAKEAATFMKNVDYTGFEPIESRMSSDLFGAAIGHDQTVVAWFRDIHCVAPDWPTRSLQKAWVKLKVPGKSRRWKVTIYDPLTLQVVEECQINRKGGSLRIELPPFIDSLVLKAVD